MEQWNLTEGQILIWIQEHLRADWLTPWMKTITSLGDAGLLWIVLTLTLLIVSGVHLRQYQAGSDTGDERYAYWRNHFCTGLMGAVGLVLMLCVNNLLLKNLIARTRPYEVVPGLINLISKPSDFSFPSGHTAASFTIAWIFLRRMPDKIRIPALIMAVLIAFSRMYVGVHYPTDILGGFILGILYGEMGIQIIQFLDRRKKV